MKKIVMLFLLLLQTVNLPQNNFIQQITNGDFDARNPFIYKDEYGFYNNYVFFEMHKAGSSNIYYKRYNSTISQFEDTVALTKGNFTNLNPSFHPSFGVIYQTNKYGNWDIAFIPDSDGVWGNPALLTNSVDDEIIPKYFERTEDYFGVFQDSTNILFSRNGDVVFLDYNQNQITEEVIFKSDSQYTYSEYVGMENNYWFGDKGFYIFAIEKDNNGNKKIVRKYKPYSGSTSDKVILEDSCDCSGLNVQYSNYNIWGLFYTDTLQDQKRYYVLEDPISINPVKYPVDIKHDGNLSAFDIYYFNIITEKNAQTAEPELFMPYTFLVENNGITKVRFDPWDLGIWDRDSLVQIAVPSSNLAIGSVGIDGFDNLIYTIWEDSIDEHIQLFGTTQHLSFGAVENESYANDFVLYQNYPNPFNPSTKIEYKLFQAYNVKFNVVNILGEKVFEQNFGYQTAGSYNVNFSGKYLSSGVYIYSIYTNENRLSRKMMLMK